MTEYWNAFLQWLHRVGLHPDREAVEQAARQAGDAMASAGGAVAATAGKALSGMDMASLLALAAALGWASGFGSTSWCSWWGCWAPPAWWRCPAACMCWSGPAVASGGMLCGVLADKIPGWIRSGTCCKACCAFPPGRRWRPACSVPTTPPWPRWPPDGRHAGGDQPGGQDQHACADQHQPEPFSNVGASLVEDTTAVGAIWLALAHPLVFGVALLVVVIAMWLVIWALWRFARCGPPPARLVRCRGGRMPKTKIKAGRLVQCASA
jgi:hypothetical protein